MKNTWNLTSFSFWAVFSLSSLSASFSCTAEPVRVVNGGTNATVYVESTVGVCVVAGGQSVMWDAAPDDVVAYGTNGVEISTWTMKADHEYGVFLSADGGVYVLDLTPTFTRWFWTGFAFIFMAGLLGISARWTRQIIGGSAEA